MVGASMTVLLLLPLSLLITDKLHRPLAMDFSLRWRAWLRLAINYGTLITRHIALNHFRRQQILRIQTLIRTRQMASWKKNLRTQVSDRFVLHNIRLLIFD